jgi:hypothetical protein
MDTNKLETKPKKHITVNGHKYTLKNKRKPNARNIFMSAQMKNMPKTMSQTEKFKQASTLWNQQKK